MAGWGSGSSFWGSFGEIGETLLLYINRDVPIIPAITDIVDARFEAIMAVLRQIEVAFDLDTATGVHLEIIGEWLGLERGGLTDARYRRALKVQRTIILSTTGTRAALLEVWASWVEAAAERYNTIPPAEVALYGPVAQADRSLLKQFLLRAAPAGVRVEAYDTAAGDLIPTTSTSPGAGTGVTGYSGSPGFGAPTSARVYA